VIQEHLIKQSPFSIEASGKNYVLPTDQSGDYKLQISDAHNLLLSQIPFSIIGESEKAGAKNAVLTLKLNKKTYMPGENIQLNITSPYHGWGLITLERDKVYAFKWFKMQGESTIESIAVPSDFEGTGYVNVALVRDWNSDEIFMNPLSYTVQAFSVTPDFRRMHITLNAPDQISPGKPLLIKYTADKPGNIIIYAVDEGILQAASYQTPDPLGYYFKKQGLTVDTAQIADQILPKFIANRELSAIGGGGEQKTIASNLNPFARKTAPVVYWSGILPADKQVRQVVYPLPDYFNGTLRLIAVGVTPNAVGSAVQKIISKEDYVLSPNAPAFVAPHDQFEVSVTATNTTAANIPVTVSLKNTLAFTLSGPAQQTLTIAPYSEKTAIFKLNANNILGAAPIEFIARAGNKTFQRKIDISVRPVTPYQTTLTSGYAASDKHFSVTRRLYPQYRSQKALISSNPFILITGLKDFLNSYPYSCTEQLVSGAFVQLALKDQSHEETYNKIIQLLRQRQTSEGSFAYWPSGEAQPFATIYTADFLTESKRRGNDVPANMLNQVLAYLKEYAGTPVTGINDARRHAYAIYILTRNEIITTDYIANLQAYFQQVRDNTWQQDITGVYLAAAYQMLQNKSMADKLISAYKLGTQHGLSDDFYTAAISDAQYIDILANYFPARLAALKANQLMPLVNNLSGEQINSLSAAFSARALSDYAKAAALSNTDHKLSIFAGNKNNTYLLYSSEFSPDITDIQFKTQENTGYFYQIIQSGFDINPPSQAIQSGLEVFREFQTAQGNPVTSAVLGNMLEVHLRIRTTGNQLISHIAVIDLLPGGFEVVPNSVKAKNTVNSYLNYYDVREDRIIFYLTAAPDAQEYTYSIRPVNKGVFTVPPVFAVSMYNPRIVGKTLSQKMVVN
jgi:uncharacterized protein YfaS (alpha-2-macroglobulin family)